MTKPQTILFSILHALSALLLPLLITLLGGCVEPEQMQVPPQVACEEVEIALNQAIKGSEKQIKEGSWVQYEDSVAPLSQSPIVVGNTISQLYNVIPRGDDPTNPDYYEMRILDTRTVYKNNQAKTETKESLLEGPAGYRLCPSGSGVTYHGLQLHNTEQNVTVYKDGCGSFPNCKIHVTTVKFDQLVTYGDGSQSAIKYQFTMSGETPYIGRILSVCVTQNVDLGGQQGPVTQCSNLKNFSLP